MRAQKSNLGLGSNLVLGRHEKGETACTCVLQRILRTGTLALCVGIQSDHQSGFPRRCFAPLAVKKFGGRQWKNCTNFNKSYLLTKMGNLCLITNKRLIQCFRISLQMPYPIKALTCFCTVVLYQNLALVVE